MRILVVESNAALADELARSLRAQAYAVDVARDASSAEDLHFVNEYDLVVLDWDLPEPDGLALLQHWRRRRDQTPVLMLHGDASVRDRVVGLDQGADDFLIKPFAFDELLARVRSLLRRRSRPLATRLAVADLEMDRATHSVTRAGRPVELAPKEFALLEYFLSRPDEVVTRTELIEHVWDDRFDAMSNTVDVAVCRLRHKIDDGSPDTLLDTVKGVGYVLRDRRSV